MHHRAHAGEHGTAEDGGDLEIQVLVDLDQGFGAYHRVFGKAGHTQMVIHVVALLLDTNAVIEQGAGIVGLCTRRAQRGAAVGTVVAVAAAGHEGTHDMIADLEALDVRAYFDDFAGRFMAQHHGRGPGTVAVDGGQIGMTQPGRMNLDEHFARLRRIELEGLDLERLGITVGALRGHFAQYGSSGLHKNSWSWE